MSENNHVVVPQVSILIPVFNKLSLTRQCLQAIQDNTPSHMIEVIVIDNGSTDGTVEFLTAWHGPYSLRVIRNKKNMGFAQANNQGARMAQGNYLVLLNNDTQPQPNWLQPLLEVFSQFQQVGAVGAKLLYPDGTIQHAGVITVTDTARKHPLIPVHYGHHRPDGPEYNKLARFPAVTGACMMVLKSVYQKVGGLDEVFWNGYEDVDFCFRLLEADLDIFYQPQSVVIHYESKSGDQLFVSETKNYSELIRRWSDKITCLFELKENNCLVPYNGVTVVIVTYNSTGTIASCLEQLNGTLRAHDEVVIVDNASMDGTQNVVQKYVAGQGPYRFIANQENLGYAHAANMGAHAGQNPYIIFVNPDTIVTANWIERLLFHLLPHKIAAVGPLSNYVAGLQKVALHLPQETLDNPNGPPLHEELWKRNATQSRATQLLIGFCLMVKRKVFDRVGGMDNHLFLGNDDLDLSWRLRDAGYRLVVATDTLVYHKGQESFASEPKALTDQWVQESSDYLYYKLLRHFGVGKIPSAQDLWGIDWFTPKCVFNENQPLTSMIVLTFNQLPYTRHCIESVFKYTQAPFELIVVDNGSTDGTLDYITRLKRSHTACVRIKIITNPKNNGFARGCNQGLAVSRGQFLLLLNNDVVVTRGWLSKLSHALSPSQVGFSGPMSNYVSGHQMVHNVGYNRSNLEGLDNFADSFATQHLGQIIQNLRLVGFCMLIKRALIEKIGGLDEGFKVGNFEDDDFCLRAHLAGYRGAIVKDCFVHHYGSQSFVGNQIDFSDRLQKNWDIFKHKWGIPPEIRYTAHYRVPVPTGGFDRTIHFMPFEADQRQQVATQDERQDPATPKIAKQFNGKTPGGSSMQIADQVLEAVKQNFSSQHREVAIWILERIIEMVPQHGSAHHELGMLYYEQRELAKAQSHLHQAVRFSPDNHVYYKDLGDFFHVVHKDNVKALQMYEKTIGLDPHNCQVLLTAAHLCTAENDFEKAIAFYQRVLELEPDNQDARICFNKLKDRIETRVPDESAETVYLRAQSQRQAGDRQGAAQSLMTILEMEPGHALAHNDFAVLAYEKGDKDDALLHYAKAVALHPENLLFKKNLSDFYWWGQGNAQAAMKLNVQILGADPTQIETILSCAQICLALGKNNDARDFVNRARELDPFNENAGQLDDQLDKRQGVDTLPADRNALFQQATIRAGEGDLDDAVDILTRLVSEYRQDAEAFNSLGVLYFEMGHKEKALSCYREAVHLKPGQATFMKNLADFHMMEQGQAEDAMKLYLSVLENNPRDVDSLLATGVICISMNKMDDARVFFERVMEIDPPNQSAIQALRQIDGRGVENSGNGIAVNAHNQREIIKSVG